MELGHPVQEPCRRQPSLGLGPDAAGQARVRARPRAEASQSHLQKTADDHHRRHPRRHERRCRRAPPRPAGFAHMENNVATILLHRRPAAQTVWAPSQLLARPAVREVGVEVGVFQCTAPDAGVQQLLDHRHHVVIVLVNSCAVKASAAARPWAHRGGGFDACGVQRGEDGGTRRSVPYLYRLAR